LRSDKESRWDPIFLSSNPEGGYLPAGPARVALEATGVKKKQLKKIWNLADIDRDGRLDAEEFAVAMHLCEVVKEGGEVPEGLEEGMVPEGKR